MNSTKPKVPIVTIAQEYYDFTKWSQTKLQLTPSDTFVSGYLYIASNLEEAFTLEAQIKPNAMVEYLQAQIDFIFCITNENNNNSTKIRTNKYTTHVTDGVNISMNYPIITKERYIPISILAIEASSLMVRISINGINFAAITANSIHIDDIEIKVSKKEVTRFIARLPSGYAAGYEKLKQQHLQSKDGQLIIPEFPDIIKNILIKKKQKKLFCAWYASKRRVFDKSKCILIPKRQNRIKKSKWSQYQSTTTSINEDDSIIHTTVPDFEPTEEEILYQMQKQENQSLISKWRQENKTKPECEFLVVPTVQDQMRMKIIMERENMYFELKKQPKIKGILKKKVENKKSNTNTTKKIIFNLNKNTTKICSRWINQ